MLHDQRGVCLENKLGDLKNKSGTLENKRESLGNKSGI
jgi:hypothetical protein